MSDEVTKSPEESGNEPDDLETPPVAEEVEAVEADESGSEAASAEDPERLLDRLMRLQAEYENYRKRVTRERAAWTARAVESLILDLLPVLDSFDRALESAGETTDPTAVLAGMDLVQRQLEGALKSHGVSPIDSLGEIFDPNLHEAFMSRPAEAGEEPGTIVTEVVKGYRLKDRTIRPAKGIVAAVPETDSASVPSPEEE